MTNKFVAVLILAGGLSVLAQAETKVDSTRFSTKIDTWMEGTIMVIDADSGKLGVRGAKRAYATSYAKMLNDIDAQTANLDPNVRAQKIAELRAGYRESLNTSALEKPESEGDFTFYLPSKEIEAVHVLDESASYGETGNKIPATAAFGTELSKEERSSLAALKDFKVGQRVVIGYARGVVYNNAYTIIKVAGGSVGAKPIPAADTVEVKDDTVKTGVHANKEDLAITTEIRRAIIADKNLSVAAHNVKIFTENRRVTLRGEVKTADEKVSVTDKAIAAVGKENVVDETTVSK